jgi:hypothetical protein
MARPRLTCAGVTMVGLPSAAAKCRFMFGKSLIARTMAYPMRWVKEIFPPRLRLRKLLITIRLSAISLAGTARTEVAVGTSSEEVMFLTTAAATPRSGVVVSPSPSAWCAALAALAALAATMSSGVAVVAGRFCCAGAGGVVSTLSLPPAGAGRAAGEAGVGEAGAGVRRGRLGGGGGGGTEFTTGAGAAAAGAGAFVAPLAALTPIRVLGALASAKKSRQIGSTLLGSARNCWYFSSTNQSLGPNSGAADDTVNVRLF